MISRSVRSASAVRASRGPGRRQLLDEPGVGDGDGRLAAKRPDERGILVVERIGEDRVDLDDAEWTSSPVIGAAIIERNPVRW